MKVKGKKLVKCLVCGEIFDASLEICPVCGVDKSNFIPWEEEGTTFTENTEEFYVILGNGAAGFSAARAIRERDKTGSIVMISNEPELSYNRPMLTKALPGNISGSEIAIEPESWYEENRIFHVLGKNVTAIDMEEKQVVLEDNMKFVFTRLIYALGAECFIPPIPGTEKKEVIAIRRLFDVQRVAELIPDTREAVVIGGGVLGLEAAWELTKAGCKVTVLEVAPVLMGRQLDEAGSALMKRICERNGVEVHTGVTVASIEGESAVTGVALSDGRVFPAQLVIVSSGVRANVALAKETGIDIDRAVLVDAQMKTNLPDVYACGDCAQYQGVNYAIWPEACAQGTVAGANAVGEALSYVPVPAALTFHGMDSSLYAIGDTGKNPDIKYKEVELLDEGRMKYEKYYFAGERLCGAILIGDVSKMAQVSAALEEGADYTEFLLTKEKRMI